MPDPIQSGAGWSGPEIAEAAGLDYRTLHNWRDRGLLTPSIRDVRGSGRAAVYSDDDLIRACLLAALRPFLTIERIGVDP